MRKRSILLLIMIIFLSFQPTNTQIIFPSRKINSNSMFNNVNLVTQSNGNYIPADNITINGNNDFKTQAQTNGWLGSGTKNDPYVIGGFFFDKIILKNSFFSTPVALIQISNVNNYFIIENDLFNASLQYAIYFDGVSHGMISRNIFTSNLQVSDIGIYITHSNDILIENNKMIINNSLTGSSSLQLEYAENCTIKKNTFVNFPISIDAGSIIDIQNNLINNSNLVIETSAVNVTYNRLINAQPDQNLPQNFAILVNPEGNLIASIKLRTGSFIENNLFLNNYYGIYLEPASYSKIFITCPGFAECSDLTNNFSGKVLLHYSNNLIKNNDFINNTKNAIYISDRDDNNTIYRNNFIKNNQSLNSLDNVVQNTTQVFESQIQNKTNNWSYNGVGNYWSDYNYHVNTSTTASVVPMRFLVNDSDPHPVTEPFKIETAPVTSVSTTILTSSMQSNTLSLNSTTPAIDQEAVIIVLIVTVGTIAVLLMTFIEFIKYTKLKGRNKGSKLNFPTFIKNNLTLKKKQPQKKETMSEETLEILEEIIDENKDI